MIVVELITVLLAIFWAPDLGHGIGSCGGLGVPVLAAIGVKPTPIHHFHHHGGWSPRSGQVAGGIWDYLANQTEKSVA